MSKFVSYLLAIVIGCCFVAYLFPWSFLMGNSVSFMKTETLRSTFLAGGTTLKIVGISPSYTQQG
jgi:hypothetical protein